jgi:hypothetical protein
MNERAHKVLGTDLNVRVKKGTVFKCQKGHPFAEAIVDIKPGDRHWTAKIGNWRKDMTPPKKGEIVPPCPDCSSRLVLWIVQGRVNV